jgi:hypothetical protein
LSEASTTIALVRELRYNAHPCNRHRVKQNIIKEVRKDATRESHVWVEKMGMADNASALDSCLRATSVSSDRLAYASSFAGDGNSNFDPYIYHDANANPANADSHANAHPHA